MSEYDSLPTPGAPVPGSRSDPTMVTNQPALRSSSGTIWLVSSCIFVAVCLMPLVGIAMTGGAPTPVAIVTSSLLVCLLAAMFAVRFIVDSQPRRLRWLAACMLAMAVVALAGMTVCVWIVWSSIGR
jgi:hypothetical protein